MLRDSVVEDLKEQVVLLQRRIKYIQSVGTVFRQKIALIVRECARNPNLAGNELQRLYSQALGEISQVERDIENSSGGAREASVQQSGAVDYSYNSFVVAGKTPRTAQAKEDVRKAHHLCMILQEKNELKEKELALRRSVEEYKTKYEDLEARHKRLLELQSSSIGGGSGSGAQQAAHVAQRELYESRIHELEEQLITTKTDLVKLKSSGAGTFSALLSSGVDDAVDGSSSAAGAASGAAAAVPQDVATLQKQNLYLRSRIQKLKDDVQTLKASSVGSTIQLQQSLDSLLSKIDEQNKKIEAQNGTIRTLEHERVALHRDLSGLRQQHEMLTKHVALSSEAQRRQPSVGENSHHSSAAADDASTLRVAINEYQQQIAQLEASVTSLRDQLREERRLNNDKSLEIRSLGVQIHGLRSKIDTLQTHEEQRQLQQTVVHDVQSRIVAALHEIQESQNASQLSVRVQEMSERLKTLETVEMQLRQKEDQLVVAEDEILRLRQVRDELHLSLSSISSLFMTLPSSVSQVESLVLELKEYKQELRTSYDEHRVPDLVRVEAAVELQVLEAKSSRASQQEIRDAVDQAAQNDSSSQQRKGVAIRDDVDDMSDDALAALLTFPPPPPLVNLLGSVPASHGAGGSPLRTGAASTGTAGSPSPNSATLGFMSPSGGPGTEQDVLLTFQLFDESGVGTLTADVLKLCLATLGINKRLPNAVGSMAQHEFLAFCMS